MGDRGSQIGYSKKKIRYGILIDGPVLLSWQARILEELSKDGRFELCLIVENQDLSSSRQKIFANWQKIPWAVVDRLEDFISRRVFGRYSGKIFETKALDNIVPGVRTLKVSPVTSTSGFVQRLNDQDTADIEKEDLDLLIRFGFKILKGKIIHAAKHGIWSFHHGDNSWNRGGPPAFWEFYKNKASTSAVVQILNEDIDNGTIVSKGEYRTFNLSWNENKRRLYSQSLWLMVDSLKRFADSGEVPTLKDGRPFRIYDHPLYTAPTPVQSIFAFAKIFSRAIEHSFGMMKKRDKWSFRLFKGPLEEASLRKFIPVAPASGKSYWADPFIIKKGGRVFIFFEEYIRAKRKGVISYIVLPQNLHDRQAMSTLQSKIIIEQPHHLSYPFLLPYKDKLYMIPESSKANTIDLWECVAFPDKWERKYPLIDGVAAADSSLVEHDDKWWMFTNIDRSSVNDKCSELHIFSADSPLSREWTPHAANPVIINCRRARMGGGFIKTPDGKLFRCAQVNGSIYGEKILLMEIETLTQSEYVEVQREVIEANWKKSLTRMHHINTYEDLVILDVCGGTGET